MRSDRLAPPAEDVVQHEIDGQQVGRLVTDARATDSERRKYVADRVGRQVSRSQAKPAVGVGNHGDVGVVALVAAAAVGDVAKAEVRCMAS